jgi:carbon catabolite-derepressing protein kinase
MANIAAAVEDSANGSQRDGDLASSQAASPLADSMRSTTSTLTSISPRGHVSTVGILPTSLPALHKEYLERQNAGDAEPPNSQPVPEAPLVPRTVAEQQEMVRRLKPHSKNLVRLDDSAARPQSMTPVVAKKHKPVRWQFGIRSRNAPWEALLCIYKALAKLKASWLVDQNYESVHMEETAQ